MPNTVVVSRRTKFLEYSCYFVLLFFAVPIKITNYDENLHRQYESYMNRFNKTFLTDDAYEKGLQAFKVSLETIKRLNSDRTTDSSAYYGLTKYSDMLPKEFAESQLQPDFPDYILRSSRYLTEIASTKRRLKRSLVSPPKMDWRDENVVSDIEDQKGCGACWAFAVVGIAESMNAIKTGSMRRLSIQEMIDCAENNFGCDGGDVYTLLDWIKTHNISIMREEDYPLVLSSGKCKSTSGAKEGVQLLDFECGSFLDSEDVILNLLANYGPVAVAINAQSWQNYVRGTIQFHCDSNFRSLNHAVQIVGYDLTAKIPHYIVRNSWGKDFGEDGYLHIAIGRNLCGLASEVCIVKVL